MWSQHKHKIIKVLVLVLVVAGAWYWANNFQQDTVNSQADYIDTVRPWFKEIDNNYSLDQIANVRNKLLYLNSKEKSIGDSHLNLFLAFDAWQQYLESNNPELQRQADKFFEQAAISLPPLHNEINRLQTILLGDV
jgi:hypothetical protein